MARIFDIQHFCVQDGPGIRTSVFFKGCPLRCLWCHNPESQRIKPELMYYGNKCVMCGRCYEACPNGVHAFGNEHVINYSKCSACGACASVCPEKALELAGREESVDNIMSEIMRDEMFYENSGGGVTITGGEPFAQSEALTELLDKLKEAGVHSAIETSCFTDGETFQQAAMRASLMLCDIKAMTPALHKRLTGVDNAGILENIRWLITESGRDVWIRMPIIPGFNDDEAEIEKAAEFLEGGRMLRVELLPYHDTGKSKYLALGEDYACTDTIPPEKDRMEHFRNILRAHVDCEVK